MTGLGRVDGKTGTVRDGEDDFSSRWFDLAVGKLASLSVAR